MIVIMTILVTISSCGKEPQKSAWVETGRIFSSFKGTQELEAKFKDDFKEEDRILDSLMSVIRLVEDQIKAGVKPDPQMKEKYNSDIDLYQRLAGSFEPRKEKARDELTRQVWTQINGYLMEYGKSKNYAFIFGAKGSGELMYADTSLNVTNDAIEFINGKYEGK